MSQETVWIDTGVPGAICAVEETPEGLIIERNGNGTIVSLEFPFELNADEGLETRVDRLAQELKDARAELRKAQKAGAR